MSDTNNQRLQNMLDEFDDIVAWFEQDDFDIEQALEKYQQGNALATAIKARLEKVENKITVLKNTFEPKE